MRRGYPTDALSVGVAALRSRDVCTVAAEDHTAVLRVWARRYHNLGSLRTQVVCRLHAVLCELSPGGFSKHISAAQAIRVLDGLTAHGAVAQARLQLAHDLVEDLQRIDAQRREVKRRTSRAVAAAPSSITEIYGVGPIVAAAVLGYVRDIRRFPTRDRFAAYNGTAPIEASSGRRTVHRLSRRGNRRLNHAIHMAAVTQISHHGTAGYAYYQRKLDEGMGRKAALRALKRKVSDTIYTRMITDTRRIVTPKGPGGHSGNDSASSATGSHPETPALRTSHSRADTHSRTADLLNEQVLTPRPAPDKRRPRRRGTGVTVEPRTSPLRGHGQERP